MTTPVIEFRGVRKSYGQGLSTFEALKGVELIVEPGEFLAIMGPSGSGKSTTANIMGCLDRPTAGSYLFMGRDVSGMNRDELALIRRNHLGFVFQGFNLLARTSAIENVELPLVYRKVPSDARRKASMEALDKVGLAQWAKHGPAELSGGQQQRVAIARAIVANPSLLLADEPTGNLDSERSVEIMRLITELNKEGLTIVMVTHEPDMAAYASRIIRFVDGNIAEDSRVR